MLSRIMSRPAYGRFRVPLIVVTLVVLFAIGYALSGLIFKPVSNGSTTSADTGGVGLVTPPHTLQDFTLTSKTGDPISLSSLRGRAVALFFGYTNCPEECPVTLANYVRVKQLLGDRAEDVAFVFVSVDGERDTPEVVATYLDHFDADFVGMTGDEAALRSVGAEYGLIFSKQIPAAAEDHHEEEAEDDSALDHENYFVQHTSPTFLIDREGVLRMVALYGTRPETLASSLGQLLQETAGAT